ncbi:MAG: tetratricopeptide repeat protein [Rubripirellula sp.]
MNNERRHELQQNDLAIYLAKLNKVIEPYSRAILVAVAALIFGGIGLSFYKSQQTAQTSDATLQLIQASAGQDAEVLVQVSDNYPNTAAAAWARLYQGKQYLAEGTQALFTDRTNAEQLLGDADAAFRNAISNSNDPLLRSRAHFGIARAAESLGNADDAIAAYNDVIADNESEAMVKKAEGRIAALGKSQTTEFMAWFADQDFTPADPSLPPSLPGSDALPDLPDLELSDLDLGGSDDEMDLADGIEMPADGEVANKDAEAKEDAPAVEASEKEDAADSDKEAAVDQPEASADAEAKETADE